MARTDAVWTIDIGQCSLKALRCRTHDRPDRIIAEAFDYIAYPKILSQPGADPEELVGEALAQFLSRNTVRGDRVAVSVAGQNGLARFIKLPPVESKKIPDIVRYEARQQIPFSLDDVVWDYQRMGGGAEEEGFALETEIGLFAMKRDQVFRALKPFDTAGIEVDVVQLTPLALYNYMLFDQLHDLPPVDEFDPENPPPSIVILSLGTDATDLVVTNGYRVWQRSIPLGGSHFTKALTKGLKLTFAKAEHLKCNAASAQDPRALFQAMRPVFGDLLTEVQRSIGYFTSIDRNAKIDRVVALGNAMKMPGLRRYLEQSLGIKVVRADSFRGLVGPEVLGAPAFKENLLSYGVCYGLAVQALQLGRGTVRTNLLPKEIVKDRFIRGKKPWAIAAAAMLLLGLSISFASYSLALGTVAENKFKDAEGKCQSVANESNQLKTEDQAARDELEAIDKVGRHLVENVENRILWLELLRALNACLPSDPAGKRPEDITMRNELHITNLECQKTPALENWFAYVMENNWYQPTPEELERMKKRQSEAGLPGSALPGTTFPSGAAAGTNPFGATGPPAAPTGGVPGIPNIPTAPGIGGMGAGGMGAGGMGAGGMGASGMGAGGFGMGVEGAEELTEGPQGEGWIIVLTGHHYHNPKRAARASGAQYVRDTLIDRLREMTIMLPSADQEKVEGDKRKVEPVSMEELGIGYPALIPGGKIYEKEVEDPTAEVEEEKAKGTEDIGHGPGIGTGLGNAFGGRGTLYGQLMTIKLRRFDFTVQFVWKPTPPSVRLENKKKKEQEKEEQLQNEQF